jgi:excisionase family DNA binding protein
MVGRGLLVSVSELLTVSEAAEQFGVHPNTIRNWIQMGTLKAYRLGSRFVRIRPEDISALAMPILSNKSKDDIGDWDDLDEVTTTFRSLKQAQVEAALAERERIVALLKSEVWDSPEIANPYVQHIIALIKDESA